MNTSKKMTAALLAIAMLALAGCNSSTAVSNTVAEPTATAVSGYTAGRKDIERETAYSGRVMPGEAVYVIGKVQGTVSKTYFEVGEYVEEGELLFEVDPVDVMLSVNQAKAAYESAKASVDQAMGSTMSGQLLSAEASYKQAKMAYESAEDAVDSLSAAISSAKSKLPVLENAAATVIAYEAAQASSGSGGNNGAAENQNPTENGGENDEDQTLATVEETNSGSQSQPVVIPSVEAYLAAKETLVTFGTTLGLDPDECTPTKVLYEYNKSIAELESAYAQADAGYEQAEMGYKAARSAYRLAEGEASEQAEVVANAGLAQAKVGYDAALTQLSYCKVTSPISGVVEMKNVTEKGFATASNPAYVISNKDVMSVSFGVPADVAQVLQLGDVVVVENGSIVYNAKIVEVGTMVDSTSGLFKVKANIENAGPDLLTGIAVKLTAVTAKSKDAIVIPTDALYYDDGSAYVYVAVDGVAVKTMITTGIIFGNEAEVLDGIDEGDVVITSWTANLRDGAPVTVQEG